MASNLEPGVESGAEYMNSASALMQLGRRGEDNPGQSLQTEVGMDQVRVAAGVETGAQMWPFITFNGIGGAR